MPVCLKAGLIIGSESGDRWRLEETAQYNEARRVRKVRDRTITVAGAITSKLPNRESEHVDNFEVIATVTNCAKKSGIRYGAGSNLK
jgi:hypothetical protein